MSQKSYDKALFRLLSIILMLAKDERPTISSLAEEFNVSRRTIQVDVYKRLCGFDITKDTLGRLGFGEMFDMFGGIEVLSQKAGLRG